MSESEHLHRLPASLREGYQRFMRNCYATNEKLFATLAREGQFPKVMWVGCSDSRVSPEQILEASAGELFVLRNIANIVPPLAEAEGSVTSALYYAVSILKVSHVVVCGHSDCAGVKALANFGRSPLDPMLSNWIGHATAALPGAAVHDLQELAKANVIAQSEHLLEYPCMAAAIKEGRVTIHTCYYDIASGELQQYDRETEAWATFL